MQIIQSKSNIVEKVLRDKEGKLIRARFFVYENGGRIKARLVDFVYLDEAKSESLFISGKVSENLYWTLVFESEYKSPFLNLNTLFTSGSKPRAPTF